jgi:hypothetical protein
MHMRHGRQQPAHPTRIRERRVQWLYKAVGSGGSVEFVLIGCVGCAHRTHRRLASIGPRAARPRRPSTNAGGGGSGNNGARPGAGVGGDAGVRVHEYGSGKAAGTAFRGGSVQRQVLVPSMSGDSDLLHTNKRAGCFQPHMGERAIGQPLSTSEEAAREPAASEASRKGW